MRYTLALVLFLLATTTHLPAVTRPAPEQHQVTYPNAWEKLKMKGLNLFRLQVPGGWLIREGFGKMIGLGVSEQTRMMMFIEDPDHAWEVVVEKDWELNRLKGQNIYRLRVPGGWLVREAWSKFGGEVQTRMMTFVPDPQHAWFIPPRR